MKETIKKMTKKIYEVKNGLQGGQVQRKDRKQYDKSLQEVLDGLEMLSRYFEMKK